MVTSNQCKTAHIASFGSPETRRKGIYRPAIQVSWHYLSVINSSQVYSLLSWFPSHFPDKIEWQVSPAEAEVAKSVTGYAKCAVRFSLPWDKRSTHLYHTNRHYVLNAIVLVLRLKEYALTFHHWNIFLDNEKSISRHAVKFEVETRGKVGPMPDPWM